MIHPFDGVIANLKCGISRRWVATIALTLLFAGCLSARFAVPRVPSYAFDQPLITVLGRSYLPQLAATPGQSGFYLLVSGQDAFAARAALAESSQRTLDLQYYIVKQDTTATMLLYAALQAAERGVRVRLLIDDMNAVDHESDLAILAQHPNVEVRLFNTFALRGGFGLSRALELLGDSDRLNRRMHNKLWIADGAVAVIGGRNLGDAYFNASPERDFGDLDVLAAGPVVSEVSSSFDQFWNSEWALPIESITGPSKTNAGLEQARSEMGERANRFREGDYVRSLRERAFGRRVRAGTVPLITAPAEALYNVPGLRRIDAAETKGPIFSVLHQSVENAQKEVIMVTPYLVPGERGLPVLCGIARRGVRVRILTNSLVSTDVPVVHAGYARYRPRLLACGVELYELRPSRADTRPARTGLSSGASLHTKAIVVDGKDVFLGSMNLDPRSKHLNTEVALRIESHELGRQLTGLFDDATAPDEAFRVELDEAGNANASLHWDCIENDRPVRYRHEPLASEWRRWMTRLLGVLVPEALL